MNILCVLSLVHATAAVLLWIRSYHIPIVLDLSDMRTVVRVNIGYGRIDISNRPEQEMAVALNSMRNFAQKDADREVNEAGERYEDLGLFTGLRHQILTPENEGQARSLAKAFSDAVARAKVVDNPRRPLTIVVKPFSYSIQMWLIVLPGAIVPAVLIVHLSLRYLRRLQRANRGLCVSCGYDLRASPSRCPECGVTQPMRVRKRARELMALST
jgi:predicted RNA-binding Zn-ribbon protein involved in translation (DUF1610 family)